MKKVLILVLALMMFTTYAEAIYVNIYNLGPVFSPDSDSKGTNPNNITDIQDVACSIWGSVFIGAKNDSVVWPVETAQPIGIYGVGVPLASLGTIPEFYNIKFDYHLRTYDSAGYDEFLAVITQGDYLWNSGSLIGGYSWGGVDYPGLETNDLGPAAIMATVYVPTATPNYYLNLVLRTTEDADYPSWGRFSDVGVEYDPVPEPSSMMLLGTGLLGMLGYSGIKLGRKK